MPNAQTALSGLINGLNGIQKTYAGFSGSVEQMPMYGLESRTKAGQALELIRANVIEAGQSGRVPSELLQNTLTAIDEAQTALLTQNAQTIAWSLNTVSQQANAIEASLTGQPLPEGATQERPSMAGGSNRAPEPEQPGNRVAESEQRTGVVPNAPQGPNANTEKRISSADPNASTQQAAPEKQPPQSANAPTPLQSAVAAMKQADVVGKTLYDRNGAEVASIQGVRTAPDGRIAGVTIEVGGLLGIGARQVFVPVNDLRLNGARIESSSMTAEQIRSLPHSASN